MNYQLIKFPVASLRKLSVDSNSVSPIFMAIVDIRHLPTEFEMWRQVNPRDPNPNSSVSNKIKETLEDAPDMFLYRNRGLTLLAEKVTFDNQSNYLSLELSDKEIHGLLDGGHTYKVISDFLEKLPEEDVKELSAFVKLEIIEGVADKDTVVNIVAARNTSAQVKDQSLENLKGHFDKIRQALGNAPYLKDISFKETEFDEEGNKKSIDIRDILSYLVCFDVEDYSGETHPIYAYSQKNQVVKYFSDNREKLTKYIDLLPVILELHDTIYLKLPDAYNHKTDGKFGKLTGVVSIDNRPRMDKIYLPFIEKESEYKIPSGFVYPILAAFRTAVFFENNTAKWKTEPVRLLNEIIEDLAQRVGKQAIEFRNPNKLGKDAATWSLCYDFVQLELFRRNIK